MVGGVEKSRRCTLLSDFDMRQESPSILQGSCVSTGNSSRTAPKDTHMVAVLFRLSTQLFAVKTHFIFDDTAYILNI